MKTYNLKYQGNYMIEIYSAAYDELIFSRRFCVYENRLPFKLQFTDLKIWIALTHHQSIHFAVTPKGFFYQS